LIGREPAESALELPAKGAIEASEVGGDRR
jgi:hypothetical protein